MAVILWVLLGALIEAALLAAYRLWRAPRRIVAPERETMRIAVHAATATLPSLRHGLSSEAAGRAIGHLRTLVQAPGLGLADSTSILATAGIPREALMVGAPIPEWCPRPSGNRPHAELHLDGDAHGVPFGAAVAVPLTISGVGTVGSLLAFYDVDSEPSPEDTRVLAQTAALVAAQLELAQIDAQRERLAQAELQALRAQISPHFIYNVLAVIARFTKTDPEQARELLTDFAEFTRYAFRVERAYVTLAEELRNVERYLRLEKSRFGDRLAVRVDVEPEVLMAVVPIFALQPLVENAIRHGVETMPDGGWVEIEGRDLGADVIVVVRDNGPGCDPGVVSASGEGGGIGLRNVHNRLCSTFGAGYGIVLEPLTPSGTAARITVPKSRAGVRAA